MANLLCLYVYICLSIYSFKCVIIIIVIVVIIVISVIAIIIIVNILIIIITIIITIITNGMFFCLLACFVMFVHCCLQSVEMEHPHKIVERHGVFEHVTQTEKKSVCLSVNH